MAQGEHSYNHPMSYLAAAAPWTNGVGQSPPSIRINGNRKSRLDDGNDFILVENKRAKRRGQSIKRSHTSAPIVLHLKLQRGRVASLQHATASHYPPLTKIASPPPPTEVDKTKYQKPATTTIATMTTKMTKKTKNQRQCPPPSETTTLKAGFVGFESHNEKPPPSSKHNPFPQSYFYPPYLPCPCMTYPYYHFHRQQFYQYGGKYAAMAYYENHSYHGYHDRLDGRGGQQPSFDVVVGRPFVANNDVVVQEEEIVENKTVPMDESSSLSSSTLSDEEEIEIERNSSYNEDNKRMKSVERVGTASNEDNDEFWSKLSFGASDSGPTWETALLGTIPWTPMPTVLVPEEKEEENDRDKCLLASDPAYWDDEMSAVESCVQAILPIMDYDY